MNELRCIKCNKLLAKTKAKTISVQIKCDRCKTLNEITRDYSRSHAEKLQENIIKK